MGKGGIKDEEGERRLWAARVLQVFARSAASSVEEKRGGE
jgi:hypothetical protein